MSADEKMIWDVGIIGAGASGLAAAVLCGREKLKTLLLEGEASAGAKILISGGGHCNITHREVTEKDYGSEAPRKVRHVLKAFSPEETAAFFESLGVPLVAGEGGKIFPSPSSGRAVVEAFLKEIRPLGVQIETKKKVGSVVFRAGLFLIKGRDFEYFSKTVVLCTGGLSYPSTGSDGTGYEIAKAFGHHLISLTPALTPFLTTDPDCKNLSGVTLPVCLSLWAGGKKASESRGDFLFTHSGFSGPVVLDISRHWIRRRTEGRAEVKADFLPRIKEADFRLQMIQACRKTPAKTLKKFLSVFLPERLAGMLLEKRGIDGNLILNQLGREAREAVLKALFHFPLPVNGASGYDKAEATAGGVDLDEVDSATLESKFQKGLFFAGEILDADGRIGGFNLQWAWAGANVASAGVLRRLRERETD